MQRGGTKNTANKLRHSPKSNREFGHLDGEDGSSEANNKNKLGSSIHPEIQNELKRIDFSTLENKKSPMEYIQTESPENKESFKSEIITALLTQRDPRYLLWNRRGYNSILSYLEPRYQDIQKNILALFSDLNVEAETDEWFYESDDDGDDGKGEEDDNIGSKNDDVKGRLNMMGDGLKKDDDNDFQPLVTLVNLYLKKMIKLELIGILYNRIDLNDIVIITSFGDASYFGVVFYAKVNMGHISNLKESLEAIKKINRDKDNRYKFISADFYQTPGKATEIPYLGNLYTLPIKLVHHMYVPKTLIQKAIVENADFK